MWTRIRQVVGTAAAVALASALGAFGCGDGIGPEEGSVSAAVTDDPAQASAAVAPRAQFAQGISGQTFQGDFQAEGQVEVSVDGQTFVTLGPAQAVDVALQSGTEAVVHASAVVPAQAFTRARLILRNARATVLAGSSVGGLLLDLDVQINVEGGAEFVIEKAVSLNVTAGSEATVVFDLNSEQWINETAVQAAATTAAQVAAAASASVR